MEFNFNEDQEMLKKSAREFLTSECPVTLVREMESNEKGYSADLWKKIADIGWLGIVFPEEYGGTGYKFMDLVVLLEEMGRSCLPGPFLATVLSGLLILDSGTEQQKRALLPNIANGDSIFALALTENSGLYSADFIDLQANLDTDNYILNGKKMFVSDAHIANYYLCVARTKTEKADPKKGITVFVVDAKSPGISNSSLGSDTIARDKIFVVDFKNVKVPKSNMLGELHQGWKIAEKLMKYGAVAECARMLGGAKRVLEMSVAYAKERIQFGRPVGALQIIQHYLANMLTEVDGSNFITYEAAWKLSEGLSCAKEVSVAKAWVSDAYYRICIVGHQIHGGIGFTQDHEMGLYFRRAKAQEISYGDADFHRAKLAIEIGLK
jgi:alkylation response protein AidB-like acyl-CoA dehydrogenase